MRASVLEFAQRSVRRKPRTVGACLTGISSEKNTTMKILLYSPDNGVTKNFMPHLWMFFLQSLTPPGHEVVLVDGNAQPMDEAGIARFVQEEKIDLVGIGGMAGMGAKAYRMAAAVRAA